MKKLALILASLLVACSAMAAVYAADDATTPSKATSDLVTITTSTQSAADNVTITTSTQSAADNEEYAAAAAVANEEFKKLKAAEDLDEYFGDTGVNLADEFEEPEVKEFMAIVLNGYNAETIGDLTVAMTFKTTFVEGEKVIVMIGIADATTGEVVWTAIKGVGAANGGISYVIPAKVAAAMAGNRALISVIGEAL